MDDDGEGGHVHQGADGSYKWLGAYQWADLSSAIAAAAAGGEMDSATLAARERDDMRRRHTARGMFKSAVQRGMHRHVFLVIDFSKSMNEIDMKPSRITVAVNACIAFIKEFFAQNPISQIGVIITRNGISEKLTDLSGNPSRHIDQIEQLLAKSAVCATGEPSLQNALLSASASLKYVPHYGCREIISVMASLTTTDPGNILDTVALLKKHSVRCSVISLTAEVFIYKHLAEQTGGTCAVALNDQHVQQLLLEHVHPPPVLPSIVAQIVKMGFPTQILETTATFCACHKKLNTRGYLCPQCGSKACELPIECAVCGLMLLSSPHLARTYHHMFPIVTFKEQRPKPGGTCHACMAPLSKFMYSCPNCLQNFCIDCDAYIHDSLHNCPGCEMSPSTKSTTPTASSL
ncbi:TFIIH subunit [Pelomyxa schiedti]|nr:TFIIH subunit [Pelomyxa schiedti]